MRHNTFSAKSAGIPWSHDFQTCNSHAGPTLDSVRILHFSSPLEIRLQPAVSKLSPYCVMHHIVPFSKGLQILIFHLFHAASLHLLI